MIARDHRQNRQVDRAEGGDAGADLLNEVAGGLALANAGDHTAVVLDILRNFNRVEADRRIEEREAEDHQRKDQLVAPAHGGDMVGPPVIRGGVREERQNGRRELHDGAREDQRQDAGGVQLQRDVRGLTAVHLPPNHPLGILDGEFCARRGRRTRPRRPRRPTEITRTGMRGTHAIRSLRRKRRWYRELRHRVRPVARRDTMPAKISRLMPLPNALFRDASPPIHIAIGRCRPPGRMPMVM